MPVRDLLSISFSLDFMREHDLQWRALGLHRRKDDMDGFLEWAKR
jgi:hypothetical protein